MSRAAIHADERALAPPERAFLKLAREKFNDNADWLDFEEFAFGSRSPLFSKTRSHRDVLTHPLYIALKDMWLDLGVRQGRIAAAEEKGSSSDAQRRTAKGRR